MDQGQSIGQASRQRERAGTPVGNPVDLVEFLGGMELGQYAQVLMDNEIDLEAVQLMADSDFQDIGAFHSSPLHYIPKRRATLLGVR